jgi:TRAP-type C4-dicarboxylate transport system permease small subunit
VKIVGLASRALCAVCGALAAEALLVVMLLTFADVVGRKLLGHSVPGAIEVTELLMVGVIFAALPLVSLRRAHVVFDSLDSALPAVAQNWQRNLVELGCGIAMAGVSLLMWRKASDFSSYGETTAFLGVPIAPFVYAMSVLLALTAVAHGLSLLARVQRDD